MQDVEAYLRSNTALAQVLSHESVLQIAEPSTLLEVCLGQEHVPETEFLRPLLQVLDDRRVRREALLGGVADLAEVYLVGRDTFFFDELLYLYKSIRRELVRVLVHGNAQYQGSSAPSR